MCVHHLTWLLCLHPCSCCRREEEEELINLLRQEELEEKRRGEEDAARRKAEAVRADMIAANQYQMRLKV